MGPLSRDTVTSHSIPATVLGQQSVSSKPLDVRLGPESVRFGAKTCPARRLLLGAADTQGPFSTPWLVPSASCSREQSPKTAGPGFSDGRFEGEGWGPCASSWERLSHTQAQRLPLGPQAGPTLGFLVRAPSLSPSLLQASPPAGDLSFPRRQGLPRSEWRSSSNPAHLRCTGHPPCHLPSVSAVLLQPQWESPAVLCCHALSCPEAPMEAAVSP